MKTMTCKQTGGVCDEEFHGETLDEIGEMSKKHAMEMAEKGDQTHIDKMGEMKDMMNQPEAIKDWHEKIAS